MDPGALGGQKSIASNAYMQIPKMAALEFTKDAACKIPDKFVRPTELLGHKYGVLFLSVNCLIINRRRNDLKLQIAACMLQTW